MDVKEYFRKNPVKLKPLEQLKITTSGFFWKARIELGLTQTKLARKMKTNQVCISRWESMESLPSLEVLVRLAQAQGKKLKIEIE